MKPYDTGLIVGRFQTLHVGHQSLIDTGLKLCDRVIVMIGSAQECGTRRNPLNINTRTKMLEAVYGDSIKIYAIADMTDEDDIRPEWGRYLLDNVERYIYKPPELMVYGNDEARSRWFSPEDIKDTSEFIVNRGRIPISATDLRTMMIEDNRREWMRWVDPKLHKMYDELRNELMTVKYYQDMASSVKM